MTNHGIITIIGMAIGLWIFFYYDNKDEDMHKFGGCLFIGSHAIEMFTQIFIENN